LVLILAIVPLLVGQESAKQPSSNAPASSTQVLSTQKNLLAENLNIAIWPEFDDPRVLVIFRGQFDPSTFKPTQIGFDLPPMAEVVGAGYISEKGELLLHPYQVVPGDRGDLLILKLPLNRFFLEYYYQAFGPDPNRSFTYETPIGYPIKSLTVRVQRPLTARNFVVDPPANQIFTDGKGFEYHGYEFTDLEPGTTLAFNIRYSKSDPSPSVLRQPAPPVPQAGPPPPPREGAFARVQTRYMPFMLGGLVVVGVGLIVLWAMGRVPGMARRTPCDNCERMILNSHGYCPHCGGSQGSEPIET
jgi:hypothetical protein